MQVVDLETNAANAPKLIKGLTKKVKNVSFFVVVKSDANGKFISISMSVLFMFCIIVFSECCSGYHERSCVGD